jgi:hypothetical protein
MAGEAPLNILYVEFGKAIFHRLEFYSIPFILF